MPKATANSTAPKRADRSRKWGNRRPTGKRLDLTPEEAERREKERQAKLKRKFVGAFVTEAEKATIAKRAKSYGMKESGFIRTVLLSDLKEPPPPRTDPEAVRALAFQLSKIGTNLNQLAKISNETGRLQAEQQLRGLTNFIERALERVIAL